MKDLDDRWKQFLPIMENTGNAALNSRSAVAEKSI